MVYVDNMFFSLLVTDQPQGVNLQQMSPLAPRALSFSNLPKPPKLAVTKLSGPLEFHGLKVCPITFQVLPPLPMGSIPDDYVR